MKEFMILLVFFIKNTVTEMVQYEYVTYPKLFRTDNVQYHDEPVTPKMELFISPPKPHNLDCENFSKYAFNCTVTAALLYNSTRKAPPMPSRMYDWCSAIKHLTNCAKAWNSDCKDVTSSHFNEDSIAGHDHVVKNICEDDMFLIKYDEVPECLESITDKWETCYNKFKEIVDIQKNTSREWTHYAQHFYLCCARAQFRRCTLDVIFKSKPKCSHINSLTMQRFSVIVSEGDVYQDCDFNMVYKNCPGGDPRPKFETHKFKSRVQSMRKNSVVPSTVPDLILLLVCLFFDRKYILF